MMILTNNETFLIMKKMIFPLLALVMLAGCVGDILELNMDGDNKVPASISASIESNKTRITLSEGVKVLWDIDDAVSVFMADASNVNYTVLSSDAGKGIVSRCLTYQIS